LIGQGSFSDGMPLGYLDSPILKSMFFHYRKICLKGENPLYSLCSFSRKDSTSENSQINNGSISKIENEKETQRNNKKDDSLLNKENKRPKGEQLEIKNYFQVPSTPGVYCIRNKHTNMNYVGETNNLKTRLHNHYREMSKSIHTNSKMNIELKKYPLDNFEFIIVQKGVEWTWEKRFFLEKNLQTELRFYGFCHNTGTGEQYRDRSPKEYFSRQYSTLPGVILVENTIDKATLLNVALFLRLLSFR
jgi:hypothetical protein